MPYRRLPNTDSARLRALQKAYSMGKELPPFKLAFSQQSYRKLISFLPQFEKAIIQYKSTYEIQVKRNKEYLSSMKKAKLYISHFVQVTNLAILRGELPESTREYFDLDGNKVPPLNTEQSIIEVGRKLIDGEEQRKSKMLTPINNPSIAVVKVRYENFCDKYQFQKTLQKDNKRSLDELTRLREEADAIIVDIWNEVEEKYADLPDSNKRENASKYGLVYVYRKNELKRIELDKRQLRMFG
jgi:hypothetical protein